jgi:CBS domain containing-hemolysin-like protein
MDDKVSPRSRDKKEKKNKKKSNTGWVVTAFTLSFSISLILSALTSDQILDLIPVFASALILIAVIALGIVFDIIGLAIATADIKPFNSMAARKLKTGQKAVWLINNAEKASSFCNDIIGDIAGIISGATGAAIAANLFISDKLSTETSFFLTLALTSLIAAVTVGGKAIGKSLAIKHSTNIVLFSAKVLCGFRR